MIKNHKLSIKLDKQMLLSALDRAALVTEERIAGSVRSHVKLEVVEKLLKISATSASGSTYDEIVVDHEGPNLVIAFNNRFLIDSVRACDADMIKISMSSSLTSINIEPDEDEEGREEIFMILPVRMKD
jgi:DNA polymerase-3 subunit beta